MDIPTHAPLDKPLYAASIKNLTSAGSHSVPTLIMMQSIVNNTGAPIAAYTVAVEGSVTAMYKAGVPIMVRTDVNTSPYVPAKPPFGELIHESWNYWLRQACRTSMRSKVLRRWLRRRSG